MLRNTEQRSLKAPFLVLALSEWVIKVLKPKAEFSSISAKALYSIINFISFRQVHALPSRLSCFSPKSSYEVRVETARAPPKSFTTVNIDTGAFKKQFDQVSDWGFACRRRDTRMKRAAETCLPHISKEECTYLLSMLGKAPDEAPGAGPCRGPSSCGP